MVDIKVLGTGCPRCKRMEEVTREAVAAAGAEAAISKVTDMKEITTYPILGTPGLVINEKLVAAGRVPSKSELVSLLAMALAEANGSSQ